MTFTANMQGVAGHSSSTTPSYGGLHANLSPQSHFHSSTSCSDLIGFSCTNITAEPLDDFTKSNSQHASFDDLEEASAYPSPPQTRSDPKRSIPLPRSSIDQLGPLNSSVQEANGTWKDLTVMDYSFFANALPLSPPPTLPTPLAALPPTVGDVASTSERRNLEVSTSFVRYPSTVQLLSPLSPELGHRTITSMRTPMIDNNCVLLSEDPPFQSRGLETLLLDDPDAPHSPMLSSFEDGCPWTPPSLYSSVDIYTSPSSSSTPPIHPEPSLVSEFTTFPHPSSPLIHEGLFTTGESNFTDDMDVYASPSLRSFGLPQLDMDYDDSDDDDNLIAPLSPTSTLIDLPGAECSEKDDDLPLDPLYSFTGFSPDDEPPPLPSMSLSAVAAGSRSLLLIDCPNDHSPPRSPSPDMFDIDPALTAGCSDPDLQKLLDLRRRAQVAEKAAKQLEQQMFEEGALVAKAEARSTRKKEKERCKEIYAMVQLTLSGQGVSPSPERQHSEFDSRSKVLTTTPVPSPTPPRKAKRVISSMAQLVARMVLRRRDTERSIVHAIPISINAPKHYVRSPLWQSTTLEDEDEEDDDDDDDDLGVGLQLKGFDGPSWSMTLGS